MSIEGDLHLECSEATLARARSIASVPNRLRDVTAHSQTRDGSRIVLLAKCRGTQPWDLYDVEATVNERDGRIAGYSCTCAAYFSHDGMCKHCAALVMRYLESRDELLADILPSSSREGSAPRSTTPALARIMDRRKGEQEAAREAEPVDLIPSLHYGFGYWSVEFKIARGKTSYVLKSISEFVECVSQGAFHSYGKKLAFRHVPGAFSERRHKIESLLARGLEARRQTGDWWRRASANVMERRMDLTDAETVELLDIMDGAVVDIAREGGPAPTLTYAKVEDLPPELTLNYNPVPRSGVCRGMSLSVPGDAVMVRSQQRAYVWRGDAIRRCPDSWAESLDVIEALLDPENGELFVSMEDLPLFAATVVPLLEEGSPFPVPDELKALEPQPCKLRFYFDREGDEITCDALACYGEERLRVGSDDEDLAGTAHAPVRIGTGSGATESAGAADASRVSEQDANMLARALSAVSPQRDRQREAVAEALVERFFGEGWLPNSARMPLDAEAEVADLLFGGLAEFRSLGDVHATAAFERLLRDRAPRITFGVSLSGNLLNLTVRADDLPPAELAELLSSYRKRKRYHILKSGAYLDLADCDLSQLDRLVSDLGISAAQLASGSVPLPSFRAFYLDEEADLERDRSFTRYVESFRSVSENDYEPPASLADVLRPYQAEGFRWLSARVDAGFSGALADEMGLGKSLQIISVLLARAEEARKVGKSLVVCPASLVYNWTAEFARFAPELNVLPVTGTKRERAKLIERACDVLVVSYDTLRIDSDAFSSREYWCCVLDEAQFIKNPAARVTRAAKRVQARHRFALTGTPMENRLSDLWSIFDFLMPGILGPYARFRERFEQPIAGGDEDASDRLKRLIGPFMLRRRKADVLADLPDKLESVVLVELQGEQRKLYLAREQQLRERLSEQKRAKGGRSKTPALTRQARDAQAVAAAAGDDFSRHRVEILAELTKLRQICCDPALLYEDYDGPVAKLDALSDLIGSAIEADEKVLVFSQFTSFLSVIADMLRTQRVPFYTIIGSTPKKKRLALVDAFNADNTPVFLISLKAGGTGLNLTGASVVIHADPWWNAAAQNQATDRAHRIGQSHVVSVEKIIAKGTIEERILRLQEAKAQLADQVVDASGASLTGMTSEDIKELLDL